MLKKLATDLWVGDSTVKMPGMDLGIRMTVIRLANGDLWIHSPIRLTPELEQELNQIGTVKYIVSPNTFHHLYMGHYGKAWPDARLYASPGLVEKRSDLTFYTTLGDGAEKEWAEEIQQMVIKGNKLVSEVVFFHPATQTLIVADACFNIQNPPSLMARWIFGLLGHKNGFGPSKVFRLFTKDKGAVRRSVDRILEWNFERVIVSHGEILDKGGKVAFKSGFEWLPTT